MGNGSKIVLSVCLIMGSIRPVMALELFGVNLDSTNREELRGAVESAGAVLIREGSDADWFDVYDSSSALVGSTHLYLGFVKQDQRFAFAEYEFRGLNPKRLLHNLTIKYGAAEFRVGKFVSDWKYRWQHDGIEIELNSDWQNYKIHLSYINPANMADLLAEQSTYNDQVKAEANEISLY